MQFSLIELKDFITHSISPQSQDIENFKDKINHYLLQLKQQKDEEPQKNILRDLLRDIFKYDCNARGKIDLAIFEDSKVKVIFECKALSNKNEFIAGGGAKQTSGDKGHFSKNKFRIQSPL